MKRNWVLGPSLRGPKQSALLGHNFRSSPSYQNPSFFQGLVVVGAQTSELVSPRREKQSAHCHENSPRRPVHVLSDAMSRSGEEVSPEREFVKIPCCSSRLGENPLRQDVFNLLGCLLEPATLLTQLYMAVLYTIITLALGLQTIYYGHIYPQLKYRRQLKVETFTKAGQGEKAGDAEQQSIKLENSNRNTTPSSPIPLPACPQRIGTGRELFYRSARYLSKSHTPTAGSILAQKMASTTALDSIQESLLGSAIATQSAPASRMKSTLCLVSTLTFLGAINLLQPLSKNINHMSSNPRQQFVIHVGRKLFQVGDEQLLNTDVSGSSSIGTFLGWAMTFVYLGGRLPQICLNIRRGHAEGLNPLMFMFAVLGNSTYVARLFLLERSGFQMEKVIYVEQQR
ncbi:PQ-loop repeat [Vigna unguiculata]|uniref:PQ-loop repeat n=1 Tax=Vigna unguiculata TaxID=3917 RepID=A0A4D6M9S8_VIGUN|nr:PQ-loop repeat [Vigna unguiculata]